MRNVEETIILRVGVSPPESSKSQSRAPSTYIILVMGAVRRKVDVVYPDIFGVLDSNSVASAGKN